MITALPQLVSSVYIACMASLASLTQPELLSGTVAAAWSVHTQESLSKARGLRDGGPKGFLRSVAKLLGCDPCIAAAGVDRLHCVCGQLDEPDPA